MLVGYPEIQRRIDAAEARSKRTANSVRLLAVSKQQSLERILALYDLGIRDFGENRVQELLKKREVLPKDIRWHFIGHLQSNKVKPIVPFIHMVHSVQSESLAKELSKRVEEVNRTIPVLVEVNISGENSKNGIAPRDASALTSFIANECSTLTPSGLMGMASFESDTENTRPQFRMLRELRDTIKEQHPELTGFTELSMGMSNDFEVAIEEGATIVRIGSALFGDR